MRKLDLTEKTDALATFLRGALESHDTDYTVERRVREAVVRGTSRRDRLGVMGDPARYLLLAPVAPSYPADGRKRSGRGAPLERTDTFFCQLWHGYEDAASFEASSQAAFERVVGDQPDEGSSAPIGLLPALAQEATLSEGAARLHDPADVTLDLVALDGQAQELAHYLSFSIDVT